MAEAQKEEACDMTKEQAMSILEKYLDKNKNTPPEVYRALHNLWEEATPDDKVGDQKEKLIINQITEILNKKGFVCVSQGHGIGGQMGYAFVNKETFEYLGIQEEDLDDEDFWNVLGTTEEEIKHKLEERNKTEELYTEEELQNKIDSEDEDYKAVIWDLIKANEEAIKVD